MESNSKELPSIEEQIKDFYFLILQPNPARDTVRVIVDEGAVKFTMRRDRFYDLIERLLDKDILGKIKNACTYYGDYFFVDRKSNSVQKLHPTFDNQKLNPAQIMKDIQAGKKKDKFSQEVKTMKDLFDKLKPDAAKDSNCIVDPNSGFIRYS